MMWFTKENTPNGVKSFFRRRMLMLIICILSSYDLGFAKAPFDQNEGIHLSEGATLIQTEDGLIHEIPATSDSIASVSSIYYSEGIQLIDQENQLNAIASKIEETKNKNLPTENISPKNHSTTQTGRKIIAKSGTTKNKVVCNECYCQRQSPHRIHQNSNTLLSVMSIEGSFSLHLQNPSFYCQLLLLGFPNENQKIQSEKQFLSGIYGRLFRLRSPPTTV